MATSGREMDLNNNSFAASLYQNRYPTIQQRQQQFQPRISPDLTQNYSYASSASNLSHSHQHPRQPPALNVAAVNAAAAAASSSFENAPYSAPVTYYQGSHNGSNSNNGNHNDSISNGGYLNNNNNGIQNAAPQSSGYQSASSSNLNFNMPISQSTASLPPYPQNNYHTRFNSNANDLVQTNGHYEYPNNGHLLGHNENHGNLLSSSAFENSGLVTMKLKRKQVRNACVNCQKACKKCDEGRPCSRCVKYGMTDTCTDSARKERKRGVKRGPYKRRSATTNNTSSNSPSDNHSTPTALSSNTSVASGLAGSSLYSNSATVNQYDSAHLNNNNNNNNVRNEGHNSMQNSPSVPRSSMPLVGISSEAPPPLSSLMQPPTSGRGFFSRNEFDRSRYNNLISNSNTTQSAPPSSTSFGHVNRTGTNSQIPSLFSPSNLQINGSAGSSGTSNSQSPRTPLGSNGSGSSQTGYNVVINNNGNEGQYVHHPGSTTTAILTPNAAGAFLNPAMPSINQPFPLHIPQSAKLRGGGKIGIGGEYDESNESDIRSSSLAPLNKVYDSAPSIRYQLPSPRATNDLRPRLMMPLNRYDGNENSATYGQ